MKKLLSLLCVLLILAMMPATLCLAAGSNTDTLANWNITIVVPDKTTAVLKGSSYYIYAKKAGTIPYVMLNTYRYDSEEKFIEDFTDYMKKQYTDLKVASEAEPKTIGGKNCYEIDYTYKVSGYDVKDRRIVITVNGRTYMFASKEIESRGDTIGNMLEDVVADCIFLDDNGDPLPMDGKETDVTHADAYLYREENGTPKYWLDFSGLMADDLLLHCYFRSGDPVYYETVFILDMSTADVTDESIRIRDVYDLDGNDLSYRFKQFDIQLEGRDVSMTVKRDEKTLAGGADDNILTGTYAMSPLDVGAVYEYYQEDGQLKYWLDREDGELRLHAMFRSGDPEYYEEVFTLDLKSAEEVNDYVVNVKKVYAEDGTDVSRWFKSLTLSEVQGAVLMNVQRDEKTLAGGADDNILTGVYTLEPRTYLLPAEKGPYTAEELCEWAQIYYFTRTGFFPPEADAEENPDGTVSIHLYEVIDLDGMEHTATSAWYTVDAYGEGFDTITEESVRLFR